MLNKIRKTLLNLSVPFVKWWASLHFPFTHKKITGKEYYAAFPFLKPGVIFLTKTRGELSSLLIPGEWDHAAIYAPDLNANPDEIVLEAIGLGVIEKDLITFMTSKDVILVLKPKFLGEKENEIMARAAGLAAEQKGKPYDYEFEFQISDQKAFYCAELVWWAYDRACQEFGIESPFVPRETFGEPTVVPEDIALAKDKFEVVWRSQNP